MEKCGEAASPTALPAGDARTQSTTQEDGMDNPTDAHGQLGLPREADTSAGDDDASAVALDVVQGQATPPSMISSIVDLITAPGPFSRRLVQDHLTPSGRLALAHTCAAAWDMVLTTAQNATVQVQVTAPVNTAKLRVAQRDMVTRGRLRTALHLVAPNLHHAPAAKWLRIVEGLGQGTAWLDELHMEADEALPGTLPSPILAAIGRSSRNLRVLTITGPTPSLPSPEFFPMLRQLSVRASVAAGQLQPVLHSTGPYIRQLSHLHLNTFCSIPATLLPLLLSPDNAGAHLHSLNLGYATLDDALLGLILQCAPALQQLSVSGIQLQSDVHVHAQHRWRQLRFSDLHLSSLARLPAAAADMQLVCDEFVRRATLRCDITSAEGAVVARMKDLQFSYSDSYCNLSLRRGAHVPDADQPAALRLVLSLLQTWSMQSPGRGCPGIWLEKWTMTTELMMELHTGLPPWHSLTWEADIRWLPQPLSYATLLRLLPDSYCHIQIFMTDHGGLTRQQVEGICLGAPVRRAPAPSLRIVLFDCPVAFVEAIQHKMQALPLPNVVVQAAG